MNELLFADGAIDTNRYWWGTLSLRKGELVFCRVFSLCGEKRSEGQSNCNSQPFSTQEAVLRWRGHLEDEKMSQLQLFWSGLRCIKRTWFQWVGCIVITILIFCKTDCHCPSLSNRPSLDVELLSGPKKFVGSVLEHNVCCNQRIVCQWFSWLDYSRTSLWGKGSDSEILQSCCVFVICWVW